MVKISKKTLSEACKRCLAFHSGDEQAATTIIEQIIQEQPEISREIALLGLSSPTSLRGFVLAYLCFSIEAKKVEEQIKCQALQ